MSDPRDDSPPSFIGAVLPTDCQLWVGDLLVIVTAIERWTTMVVVHAVFPLMPEDDNVRSFTAKLAQDHPTHSIVHAVIDLSHALNMVVVAEGVETPTDYATSPN